MGTRYSEVFIEQALFEVYSRGERTVKPFAEGLNVNDHTVKNRMGVSITVRRVIKTTSRANAFVIPVLERASVAVYAPYSAVFIVTSLCPSVISP